MVAELSNKLARTTLDLNDHGDGDIAISTIDGSQREAAKSLG
jgi:hypothetical protein